MKRIVIKIGTGNLVNSTTNALDMNKAYDISRQVALLVSQGLEVTMVTSGSIKAGRDRMLQINQSPLLSKKEWAGVGARHLLNLWGNAFEKYNREVAQVWVTYANWVHRKEYESIQTGILSYLKNGLIPLINENDVVSDKEIVFMEQGISENDRLARMVAEMIGADAILFLTDIGGIYEKDPRSDSRARKYRSISRDVLETLLAVTSTSVHGTGGVCAKLQEAFGCYKLGMKTSIAGLEEDVILRFTKGESVGTSIGETTLLY